jgi:hypothetical protein
MRIKNQVRRLLASFPQYLKKRWLFRRRPWPALKLCDLPRQVCYVAFIDLLGFGSKVEQDIDGALDAYDRIFSRIREESPKMLRSTNITVVSDSLLLTSATLLDIIKACFSIQHTALFDNVLVRGAITHGVHVEVRRAQNLYLVSPALVQAVRIEQTIGHPLVVLDPAIAVPVSFYPHAGMNPLDRWLFFYDGCWVVSPFYRYFFQSVMTRVSYMMEEHPEHKAKYEWLLGLYRAVTAGEWLVPGPPEDRRGTQQINPVDSCRRG